jgi:azurin
MDISGSRSSLHQAWENCGVKGTLRVLYILPLLFSLGAWADECHYRIEANDQMQYSTNRMVVPGSCTDIEVTLVNSGKQNAKIMGHNWVLSKASDMSVIASAGLTAGFEHDWLAPGDQRIIAATKLVGGGESASVHIPSSALRFGIEYRYFCSAPGHYFTMHGRFVLGVERP